MEESFQYRACPPWEDNTSLGNHQVDRALIYSRRDNLHTCWWNRFVVCYLLSRLYGMRMTNIRIQIHEWIQIRFATSRQCFIKPPFRRPGTPLGVKGMDTWSRNTRVNQSWNRSGLKWRIPSSSINAEWKLVEPTPIIVVIGKTSSKYRAFFVLKQTSPVKSL